MTLIYSFKSFPLKSQILAENIFIFNRLKDDLKLFENIINDAHPSLIIGIAKTANKSSIESQTVNIYNKTKKVSKSGEDNYMLYLPKENTFAINAGYTDSFCNWVMFNIQMVIKENTLNTNHMFVHLNPKDIGEINELINKLRSQQSD